MERTSDSLMTWTQVIYGLHAFSLLTGILGAATVHLAAFSPVTPFVEFAPAEVYASPLRRELQAAGFPVKNGTVALPDRPGIGYDLPAEIVSRFAMP